jgi:hypothetical protein
MRVEGIRRQLIEVFRGGILADWCAFLYYSAIVIAGSQTDSFAVLR